MSRVVHIVVPSSCNLEHHEYPPRPYPSPIPTEMNAGAVEFQHGGVRVCDRGGYGQAKDGRPQPVSGIAAEQVPAGGDGQVARVVVKGQDQTEQF